MIYQGGANYEREQTDIFLKCLPQITTKEKVMIELGSNDCHYSILFNDFFEGGCKNVCVEACEKVYELGISNSSESSLRDSFIFEFATIGDVDTDYLATVESQLGKVSKDKMTIENLTEKHKLPFINVLHMDIQGSEKSLTEEIKKLYTKIQFLFISTHPESKFGPTHKHIESELINDNCEVIFNNPIKGGCGDGLIVLKNKDFFPH